MGRHGHMLFIFVTLFTLILGYQNFSAAPSIEPEIMNSPILIEKNLNQQLELIEESLSDASHRLNRNMAYYPKSCSDQVISCNGFRHGKFEDCLKEKVSNFLKCNNLKASMSLCKEHDLDICPI